MPPTSGDVIELCDDTYIGPGNRDLDYGGKAITVRSQSGDPESCVIDCYTLARGFSFTNGEGPSSVVEGIKIRRGQAVAGGGIYCCTAPHPPSATASSPSAAPPRKGAGLYSSAGSPTVTGCLFHGNSSDVLGGGLLSYGHGAGADQLHFCRQHGSSRRRRALVQQLVPGDHKQHRLGQHAESDPRLRRQPGHHRTVTSAAAGAVWGTWTVTRISWAAVTTT